MMPHSVTHEKQDYFRLVAFWVVCEAFAGGIIHSVKLPFSGMIISSLAVFCIVMIGKHFPGKGKILRATLMVCIFKLMLSPHSPPTAYVAVLFQGLLGELLFRFKLSLRITSMLLAFFALVESSIQRILVLWILYGAKFWDAVDKYLEKFSGNSSSTSIPFQLAIGYILIHAITGLAVGYYFSKLAGNNKIEFLIPSSQVDKAVFTPTPRKKRKKIKWLFLLLWIILVAFIVYGYSNPERALISGNSALWLVIRAFTIVFGWYFVVSPMLLKWFKERMEKTKNKNMETFRLIQSLLPSTQQLFIESWSLSANRRGIFRFHTFLQILAANMAPRSKTM